MDGRLLPLRLHTLGIVEEGSGRCFRQWPLPEWILPEWPPLPVMMNLQQTCRFGPFLSNEGLGGVSRESFEREFRERVSRARVSTILMNYKVMVLQTNDICEATGVGVRQKTSASFLVGWSSPCCLFSFLPFAMGRGW